MKRRSSARLLSRPSSTGAAAVPAFSLTALAPDLQRDIGSYLSARKAVHGAGLASKACRAAFLSGVVSDLNICSKPIQQRWKQHTAREEDGFSRSLACLLRAMPAVTCIRIRSSSSVAWIAGRALWRHLESPMANVTQLILNFWRFDSDASHRPHSLLQAMAMDRLPGLEVLIALDDSSWDFLDEPANARLLEQAIQCGQLPQLTVL